VGSPILPSPNFPIVFHAINGKDDRESVSPSFFNIDEVTLVKEYVQKLRADRKFRIGKVFSIKEETVSEHATIEDDDIGVIAPYHAQCLKIRSVLKAISENIKVGSVEEFQGQVSQ
jgi:helicase MOV-10